VISRVTVLNMIDPYAPFSASTLASASPPASISSGQFQRRQKSQDAN